ncbi:DUF3809 family protein [Oceanithermus sp.]
MRLERDVAFRLETASEEEARKLLVSPQRALAQLPVFQDLRLEGAVLSGALVAPFAMLGEVRFPFRARFTGGREEARLEPLPLSEPGDLRAELAGEARREGAGVTYRARIVLHILLPEGEKWGGRAFKKMAEAAFARTLARTLERLPDQVDASTG